MMEMVKGAVDMQSAAIGAQIGTAVAAKVMDTTAELQKNLLDQLLGLSGIGQNLNTVA